MFSFLSHLAHSASELLAPNLKPEEELFLQWHNLVKELKRRHGTGVSVDETEVPLRLQWVFNLIQQEIDAPSVRFADKGNECAEEKSFEIGPCLEVALRYKIFDWLVALARVDKPSGIKNYILFFVTNFLKSSNSSALIPKSFIYKPLARLVQSCGNTSCSPWDREELAFLLVLVDVIVKDPCLANLFLKSNLFDLGEKLDADLKSLVLTQNPFLADHFLSESQANCVGQPSETFTFPLLESLLKLALNPDPVVASQARQGIITVLQIREPVVCRSISSSSNFLVTLATVFRKLYLVLPDTEDLVLIILQNATGPQEHVVKSFIQWITFLDQICVAADPEVGSQIKENLLREFLCNSNFYADWMDERKDRNNKAFAVFVRTYKTVESPILLNMLSDVFLNTQLLDHFLSLTAVSDLSLIVFDLLDGIIQKPAYKLLDELILKYVENRLYIRKDQRMHDNREFHVAEAADRAAMFRDLFPTSFKSCTATEEERDCENYIRESHYSMVKIAHSCQNMKWPPCEPLKASNVLLAEESSFFDGEAFDEGPLLRALFSRLSNLFNQSYIINLRITGVLSKICLLPHSALREYLLDPTVPLSPYRCSSLYRCIMALVQKTADYAKEISNFQEKVLHMRQLIRKSQWKDIPSDQESQVLCGVITLEEFCKEMAARAFVAHNNSL